MSVKRKTIMRSPLNPTLVWFLAAFLFADPQNTGVEITLSTKSVVTVHEPIMVDCAIDNAGNEAILVDFGCIRGCRGMDATALRLIITEPSGKRIELPPSDGPRSPKTVERKSKYRRQFILNEWHDFAVPGQYQIEMWIDRDVTTVFGKVLDVQKHALLTLNILPRYAPELIRRCQEFLRQVRNIRKRGSNPTDAAYVTSFFADPACIPCIQSLYYEEEDVEATDGLKRIGTDEAFEAMILGTKSKKDREAAAYARGILRDNLPKIKNPRVRAEIIDAIK
jgi:hypothetical protein